MPRTATYVGLHVKVKEYRAYVAGGFAVTYEGHAVTYLQDVSMLC